MPINNQSPETGMIHLIIDYIVNTSMEGIILTFSACALVLFIVVRLGREVAYSLIDVYCGVLAAWPIPTVLVSALLAGGLIYKVFG